jgi:hypothetical protein
VPFVHVYPQKIKECQQFLALYSLGLPRRTCTQSNHHSTCSMGVTPIPNVTISPLQSTMLHAEVSPSRSLPMVDDMACPQHLCRPHNQFRPQHLFRPHYIHLRPPRSQVRPVTLHAAPLLQFQSLGSVDDSKPRGIIRHLEHTTHSTHATLFCCKDGPSCEFLCVVSDAPPSTIPTFSSHTSISPCCVTGLSASTIRSLSSLLAHSQFGFPATPNLPFL